MHHGDDGDLALVDRRERGVAAAIGAEQCIEALGVLHLLDVDTGVPAFALGTQDQRSDLRVTSGGGDHVGQIEPTGDGQRVDGRVVHHDLGDAVGDGHGGPHDRILSGRRRPDLTPRQGLTVPGRREPGEITGSAPTAIAPSAASSTGSSRYPP